MKKIGIERYYVQGGDWGSFIVQLMANLYPDNVIGVHSNMCAVNSLTQFVKTYVGSFFPSLVGIPKDQEGYLYPMSEKFSFIVLETGYLHIQATKPDTVGMLYIIQIYYSKIRILLSKIKMYITKSLIQLSNMGKEVLKVLFLFCFQRLVSLPLTVRQNPKKVAKIRSRFPIFVKIGI